MNRMKNFMKEEDAAAQMVEAAIIYPVVFLIIFLMIYMGLYILQAVSINTYAQKVAMLVSREVSTPGYYTLIDDKSKYSSGAIELDADADQIEGIVDVSDLSKEMTKFSIVYRYIGNPLKKNNKTYYEEILKTMVTDQSVIVPNSNSAVKVNIDCQNNILSQYVIVNVEQELMHFGLLDFFGIKNPTVSATAVATVSDTDELIRNTDFVVDAISVLASKFGINLSDVKGKVDSALSTLGLVEK